MTEKEWILLWKVRDEKREGKRGSQSLVVKITSAKCVCKTRLSRFHVCDKIQDFDCK